MPGKDSKEEQTFKGLDCATPDPHLRSDYTLTGMRPGVALPTENGGCIWRIRDFLNGKTVQLESDADHGAGLTAVILNSAVGAESD